MRQRKVPMRMCVGCNTMKPKKELVRVVCNKENEISVDLTGKKHGRGAYICKNAECLTKAKASNRFAKVFGTSVSADVYDILEEQLEVKSDQ